MAGRSVNAKRRGARVDPANRFERFVVTDDPEQVTEEAGPPRLVKTELFIDRSKSVVSENASPDVPFRYSVNPYRGCEHGCVYCYARPTHEYLGLGAGLDFETRILVKPDAPELLRQFLSRPGWLPEPIALSGVTDCYQPIERRLRLTRGCLAVLSEASHPVQIVTKNRLIERDLDLLSSLAERRLVLVSISLTTLDTKLARLMEPRTSAPRARLAAIEALRKANVPVAALIAPVIPGLTDSELPALLAAAAGAGAASARYVLLRLPGAVEPVFRDWLARVQPGKRARIEALIRSTRGGRWNDASFGARMRGTGPIAEQIERVFRLFARKHGLDQPTGPLDTGQFVPPGPSVGQLRLF